MTVEYVKWNDDRVEKIDPNEEEYFKRIIENINALQEKRCAEYGHCFGTTHIKTQAIVKGSVTVDPNLPEHLAQGLFATSRTYPVALRYSTETMARVDDRQEQPRGLSMKIFNVEGPKLREDLDNRTHDMEFNTAPAIELRDAKTTAEILDLRTKYDDDPSALEASLKQRGDFELQDARNHIPNQHLIAMRQYSQSAFRHGEYIAKYAIVPATDTMRSYEKLMVQPAHSPHIHQQWLAEFYRNTDAEYNLQAQILTESVFKEMGCSSVEDSGNEWDEQKLPFVTIAKITIPKQDSFSAARRVFWEDNLRLDPWHGLAEHRPLGSTNRVRRAIYPASSALRRKLNATEEVAVSSIDHIPD